MELHGPPDASQVALDAHLADAVDAHDASAISVVPFGDIEATNVQDALEEIVSEAAGGVADHGDLTGLTDDDHPQYHNDARGDARYWPLSTDLATQAELDAHVNDAVDAHDASAISILDTANDFTATDVEGALAELQADAEADATALSDHLADATDAHDASAISFSPTGTIAATDVQAAIAEVAAEAGGGGGTPLTVKEDGVDVDTTVTVIDFLGADFDVGAEPTEEVNVSISSAIARQAALDAHINDAADAHDASAISVLDTAAQFTGTDVEAVLAELAAGLAAGGSADPEDENLVVAMEVFA